MRAVDGTAGVARVELVCPHWGVPFCKHRSWVARSFCPRSQCNVESRGQQGKDPSPTLLSLHPQLSLSFSGVPE